MFLGFKVCVFRISVKLCNCCVASSSLQPFFWTPITHLSGTRIPDTIWQMTASIQCHEWLCRCETPQTPTNMASVSDQLSEACVISDSPPWSDVAVLPCVTFCRPRWCVFAVLFHLGSLCLHSWRSNVFLCLFSIFLGFIQCCGWTSGALKCCRTDGRVSSTCLLFLLGHQDFKHAKAYLNDLMT